MPAPRPIADIIERAPGHARILGLPRSGKTTLLVERFHHLERAGNRPLVIAFGREQHDRLLGQLIPPGTARAVRNDTAAQAAFLIVSLREEGQP